MKRLLMSFSIVYFFSTSMLHCMDVDIVGLNRCFQFNAICNSGEIDLGIHYWLLKPKDSENTNIKPFIYLGNPEHLAFCKKDYDIWQAMLPNFPMKDWGAENPYDQFARQILRDKLSRMTDEKTHQWEPLKAHTGQTVPFEPKEYMHHCLVFERPYKDGAEKAIQSISSNLHKQCQIITPSEQTDTLDEQSGLPAWFAERVLNYNPDAKKELEPLQIPSEDYTSSISYTPTVPFVAFLLTEPTVSEVKDDEPGSTTATAQSSHINGTTITMGVAVSALLLYFYFNK